MPRLAISLTILYLKCNCFSSGGIKRRRGGPSFFGGLVLLQEAWEAEEQTGFADWSDSAETATWCVRLLIKGDSIELSDNRIWLSFKGKTSGDYTISKVSIAENELYFDGADYTDDMDWSGYNTCNELHALSTIYVAQ